MLKWRASILDWGRKLGPGVIAGAADDDPSGIATYSQAGAQFGFNMLWTAIFTLPFLVAIQTVSARIGSVTGFGLAKNIREHFPPWILYSVVFLLLVANTINIAADISAMGDTVSLVVGGSPKVYALILGSLSLLLQVFIPYHRYVFFLKWLTLSLLAYVATAFVVQIPWGQVLHQTAFPAFSWRSEYLMTVVAVFGTTISPYLFFWQASQEVEEIQADPNMFALRETPERAHSVFHRIKIDTSTGMIFSNIVAYFIILTTAVTLHAHGIEDIQTSAQAASALKPLAGEFAFLLFSLGLIGTGLLAVPVLAGSAAYAVAEASRWKAGLELKPLEAKGFYGLIVLATLGGVFLTFTNVPPMKALYWSAVLNGIIAVPIMVIMMLMISRKEIMGTFIVRRKLQVLGWLAVVIMMIVVLAMFWEWGH